MPEMPEVEQVRKTLAPHMEGKKILAVEIYLERLIKYPQPDAFIKDWWAKQSSAWADAANIWCCRLHRSSS